MNVKTISILNLYILIPTTKKILVQLRSWEVLKRLVFPDFFAAFAQKCIEQLYTYMETMDNDYVLSKKSMATCQLL